MQHLKFQQKAYEKASGPTRNSRRSVIVLDKSQSEDKNGNKMKWKRAQIYLVLSRMLDPLSI